MYQVPFAITNLSRLPSLGHHNTNHPRGSFPQYPPGSGSMGSGGVNNAPGQGPNAPGRIGFNTSRNPGATGMNYHVSNNTAGYPGGGYGPSSGMQYNMGGSGLLGSNNTSLNSNSAQLPYGHASQHTTPTHSPYASSPSSSAYPNSSKNHSSSPLRRYILLPPPRKKRLHKTSDLGYPGVFPQKPGQDEDQMTYHNVKTGYIDKGIIQNETVSAQGILADGLQDPKKLQDLGAFMVEVLKKRQESSRITGPPSRATLNDQKKEQWMTDLAGTTSLRRLSKSVPHGFKSEKLLETLAQRQVPMLRATWYIKIVALSEMQAPRSRPSATQNQYSTDWTMIVNVFLKKQLLEINPHSATKPAASALNPASGSQNVKPWASEEAKEKWESKWRYSVMLTKWQYNEGLLDHRQFLRATVEQLSTLSFEQVALLLSLISMFLSEYARSRLLMRLLIEGLLNTLQLVQNHPSYNQTLFRYSYLELELKRMLQSIFLSTPDMFVIPKAWSTHSTLLQEVLLKDVQLSSHKPTVFPNVGSVLESHFKMIQARVRVFTDLASKRSNADTKGTRQGSNVEVLDRIDHFSSLEEVAQEYFSDSLDVHAGPASIPPSPSKSSFSPLATSSTLSFATSGGSFPPTSSHPHSLSHKSSSQRLDAIWKARVNTLCEWAITNSRYGHHRVYLVGTLLNIWLESPTLSAHIPPHERTIRLQSALLEFLDSFNGHHHSSAHSQATGHGHEQHHNHHGQEDTLDAVARLYGNLIHDHLFSYQQYLQRLIARGDLQPSKRGQESTLRHLKYLQSFPLHRGALPHHFNQRRVVLFGVSGEDVYDRECFEAITTQIKAKLPHMFSPEAANMTVPIKDSTKDGQELSMSIPFQLTELILSASRFSQLRVTSQWLFEAVKSYVVKHIQIGEDNWRVMTSPGSSLLNGRQLATIVNVMEVAGDFHSLYEMSTWLLEHTLDKTLLTYIVNLAKKHYMVWAAMGVMTKFSQAILAKHYSLQSKNITLKVLPRFLAFEAHDVPEDIRAQMEADLISPKAATSSSTTIPAQIQELQQLLKDTSSNAVASLASSLHFKYGGLSHWPLRLFDGCVDALRKQDTNARSTAAANTDVALNLLSRSTATQESIRSSRTYVELLVEMAERVGNGILDDVVRSWLQLHDMEWMTNQLGLSCSSTQGYDASHENEVGQPAWFLSFMTQLVIQGVCSIDVLVQDLCGSLLNKIACSIQPPPHSQQHDDSLQQQPQAIPDEATLNLCKTLVRLLRLLLLEDAFINQRTHQPYGASHLGMSAVNPSDQLGIRLTIAEIHALQTQRHTKLVTMYKHLSPNQRAVDQEGSMESSSASSLLQEEHHRMMLTQFKICRDLVWIESCLPLNHKVLHEIQEYRKDWALSADWLREKCQMDVDGAYKMFLQTREDQQQHVQRAGLSDTRGAGNVGSDNRKHLEMVDRKMMETFRMLVAESHESLLLMDTAYGGDTTMAVHQRALRSIFSRVDRWTFDRCKVEFWLLLDNVMMECAASARDKQIPGESLEKDGAHSGSGDSSSSSSMMDGVTLTSDATMSSQLPDTGINVESHHLLHHHLHHGEGDSLQLLIHIFFQEFVLSETADKELLGRMLVGMRNDVVEEFIRYGYSILAGHSSNAFPDNVMIVQRPVSSADYIKIVASFHYVMEILMNERQLGVSLSLGSDDSSAHSGTTPSASTLANHPQTAPSAQPTSSNNNNNGYINPAASALEGLDAAQLESRIEFAKSLLWQLKKFEDRIRVFDVMHAIGCSFEDAAKVVQDHENGVGDLEDLLLNASLAMQERNHPQSTIAFSPSITARMDGARNQSDSMDSDGKSMSVHLIDLRTSLSLRLRLLVPLLPVILQHPSSTACDLATYVIRLTNLLVSSIIHGHGSEERLFEFCLDLVSCLMDEVLLLSGGLSGGGADSKAIRNDILNQLRTGMPQMTTSIPTVFASRIFRILPFQQHNVYFTSLRVAGEANNGSRVPVQHKEIQPRPWDWLEDCVGDVDQSPNQQQQSIYNQQQQQQLASPSPALGLGLYDTAQSNGDGVGGSHLSGSASSLVSGSSSSPLVSSAAANASASENVNDTSISLTFFGAKQIRKSAEGTTYQRQFMLGHGGGDDELELLMVEEQQRPCEYNHSHQQQLLLLHHQQRQQQLIQQQQLEQQQQDSMLESGADGTDSQNDGVAGQQSNIMELDLFGHPSSSSTGGVRSGSVPPLPRVQEPDPELEEGQINDDDLDMNSMTMSWENEQKSQRPGLASTMTATTIIGQQSGVSASTMEEGEVVEIKDDDDPMIMSAAPSSKAMTAAPVPAVAVPPVSTTTAAPITAAAGKKRSNTGSKAARAAAAAAATATTTTTTAAPTTTAPAATIKASKGKGSRGGKGSKAAQAVAAAAAAAPAITTEPGSADGSTVIMGAISSVTIPTLPMQSVITNVSLPPTQHQQQQQQQQFQPLQQHQYQPFQVQQQPQPFQQQMRTVGGPMAIALPGQGQPQHQLQLQHQPQPQQLTSHQLMDMLRQNQNAAAAAMAASSGPGGIASTTTIGGIHVPVLNGQQQFQQQQQQAQYMDPSAFMNSNNNNSNNNPQGFGPGNPMNINLGQFNNNSHHQGWQ
ncbi:RNA polymerase II mediator complex subunit [Mortierella sp. GBA30]|nr:RNA polymerase II mediator complex subunit [Mortierella sp. GBA30]